METHRTHILENFMIESIHFWKRGGISHDWIVCWQIQFIKDCSGTLVLDIICLCAVLYVCVCGNIQMSCCLKFCRVRLSCLSVKGCFFLQQSYFLFLFLPLNLAYFHMHYFVWFGLCSGSAFVDCILSIRSKVFPYFHCFYNTNSERQCVY